MTGKIQPRVLKGFRDFLPDAEAERLVLTEVLAKVFSTAWLPLIFRSGEWFCRLRVGS